MSLVNLLCRDDSNLGLFIKGKLYSCTINRRGQPVALDELNKEIIIWDDVNNTLPKGWLEWYYD